MRKNIIIAGITGKAGKAVAQVIRESEHFNIVGAVGNSSVGQDVGEILTGKKSNQYVYASLQSALEKATADVYIDFTNAEAIEDNLEYAINQGLDIIVGTTGLKDAYVKKMRTLIESKNTFGIFASNFSLGIAVLLRMGEDLATYYEKERIKIIETHHESKIDNPSGTATYLKNTLNLNESNIVSNRVPIKTSLHEIAYHSESEQLSISYEVSNPKVFGEGVLYVLNHLNKVSGVYEDLLSFVKEVEQE